MEEYIQRLRKIKTESGLYEEGATPCIYEEDQLYYLDNNGRTHHKKFQGCEKCTDKECKFRGAEYNGK